MGPGLRAEGGFRLRQLAPLQVEDPEGRVGFRHVGLLGEGPVQGPYGPVVVALLRVSLAQEDVDLGGVAVPGEEP